METRALFSFGPFCVQALNRRLTREGVPVPIQPKTFDVLLVLLQSQGKLLHKEQLLLAVWPDVVVEESSLTRAISDLRKALGQNEGEIYIETVPKFGYRFAVELSQAIEPSAEPVAFSSPPAEPLRTKGRSIGTYLAAACALAPPCQHD